MKGTDMEIEIDTDALAEVVFQQVKDELQDEIEAMVQNGFDYHNDRFRMGWMRMAESELNELENSTKDGACNHGQFAYRAIFHAIDEYFRHHTTKEIDEMVGLFRYEEPEEEDEPEPEEEEEEPTEEHDVIYTVTRRIDSYDSYLPTWWDVPTS